jgi:hypothetical protein
MAVVTLNTAAQTQMKYGDNVFNTYQARDPEYRGAAQVLVSQPARKYTITDMLTGESTAATSDRDGYLPLDLSGWNMRGVYIAPTP